jgi:VanZ family protein
VYSVLLVILAVIPPSIGDLMWRFPDRLAHALAYGGQAGLLYWAVAEFASRSAAAVSAFAGAFAFGLLTEGLQLFQPARSVEIGDLAANGIGAAAACGLIVIARALAGRESG